MLAPGTALRPIVKLSPGKKVPEGLPWMGVKAGEMQFPNWSQLEDVAITGTASVMKAARPRITVAAASANLRFKQYWKPVWLLTQRQTLGQRPPAPQQCAV
jgi:hypothetical protein